MITQKKLVADYLQSQGCKGVSESSVQSITHDMVNDEVTYIIRIDNPGLHCGYEYLRIDSLELMCFLYSKINEAKNPWGSVSPEEYKKQFLGEFKPDDNAQFLENAWLEYYRKTENMDNNQARLEYQKLRRNLKAFSLEEIYAARRNVKQRGIR